MKKIFIIVISSLLLFQACEDDIALERQITTKVKEDAVYLAQLEAVYGLVFTNQRENWISSDDIYIRKDLASVYYGYSLDDAEITVKDNEQGVKTLYVNLPVPEKVSIDRRIVSLHSTHDDYQPVDEDEKYINIDEQLNSHLDRVLEKYEERTIEMTKKISRQYFDNLAARFGLKLELKFEN